MLPNRNKEKLSRKKEWLNIFNHNYFLISNHTKTNTPVLQTLHWTATLTAYLQIESFCILINSVCVNEGLSIAVVSMKFVLIVQPKSKTTV
jgi:hypothetical protein